MSPALSPASSYFLLYLWTALATVVIVVRAHPFLPSLLCFAPKFYVFETKVLAAEGHKGTPLDPALADLLQKLLKLDARHRLSARDALASPYFRPRADLIDERVSFLCVCTFVVGSPFVPAESGVKGALAFFYYKSAP